MESFSPPSSSSPGFLSMSSFGSGDGQLSLIATPPPTPGGQQFQMGFSPARSTSPRGMRSACNFCHTKRIKCKRDEGASKCQQCAQRGMVCKFSPKEKTGPKPNKEKPARKPDSRSPSPSPPPHGLGLPRDGRLPAPLPVSYAPGAMGLGAGLYHNNQNLDTFKRPALAPLSLGSSPGGGNLRGRFPADLSAGARTAEMTPSADSSAGAGLAAFGVMAATSSEEQRLRERQFLIVYQTTVAQLLPFAERRVLESALMDRHGSGSDRAGSGSNTRQALLTAALAIGALVSNDRAAELYHAAARAHLKEVLESPSAEAASALCMLAFYWQYKGEDEKKDVYLHHARVGLEATGTMTPDLSLVLEHLDYERQARRRADSARLLPRRRALHAVSCVLAAMSTLMEATPAGAAAAEAYCVELEECARLVSGEIEAELPILLCRALHSFILVMLGRRAAAMEALEGLPAVLERSANTVKALPLSWDATLIAATLCFVLGKGPEYARLHAVVEAAQNTSAATQWTCRLPAPGSGLPAYLNHMCLSSSNICWIVCMVGRQTECGSRSFYGAAAAATAAAAAAGAGMAALPATASAAAPGASSGGSRPPSPHVLAGVLASVLPAGGGGDSSSGQQRLTIAVDSEAGALDYAQIAAAAAAAAAAATGGGSGGAASAAAEPAGSLTPKRRKSFSEDDCDQPPSRRSSRASSPMPNSGPGRHHSFFGMEPEVGRLSGLSGLGGAGFSLGDSSGHGHCGGGGSGGDGDASGCGSSSEGEGELLANQMISSFSLHSVKKLRASRENSPTTLPRHSHGGGGGGGGADSSARDALLNERFGAGAASSIAGNLSALGGGGSGVTTGPPSPMTGLFEPSLMGMGGEASADTGADDAFAALGLLGVAGAGGAMDDAALLELHGTSMFSMLEESEIMDVLDEWDLADEGLAATLTEIELPPLMPLPPRKPLKLAAAAAAACADDSDFPVKPKHEVKQESFAGAVAV